ncbi:MAG: hypothetical protein ACOY0T_21230 [Myxococcota bacterium]
MKLFAQAERNAPLAAALIAVVSHATAIGGGYVWLDHAHIEQGLALAKPGAFASLFASTFAGTGFYRPLMSLSLSLDAAVSSDPALMHVVSLAWHALASALLVLVARALGSSQRVALVAGALFAAHPLTSLVASAIAFRSEAMALVFLLALILFHLRSRPIAAALALIAGALSKETAWLLAPLFVAVLELTAAPSTQPNSRRARLRLLVAEAIAFVSVSALRLSIAQHRATFPSLSWDENIGTRLGALGKGLLRVLVPVPNTICDAFPVSSSVSALSLLGAALVFLLLALRLPQRRVLGLALLSLLPSLQLVPIMRWWSPHYFYIPLGFLAVLATDLVERRWPRVSPAWLLTLALYSGLSLVDGRRFRNDEALWSPEVARQPACREGQFYLAEVARERGDWQRAALHYERALRPHSSQIAYVDELAAYQNWGAVLIAGRQWAQARDALREALARSGTSDERRRVTHNLALTELRSGDAASAAELLAAEVNQTEPQRESLLVRARALHELGREDEAQDMLRRFAARRP